MAFVESLESRSLMAAAPPAGLDLTFGNGTGFVDTPLAHNVALTGVATQPDGKILVSGYTKPHNDPAASTLIPNRDFFLARLNPDGTLDASFGGGDGCVTAGPYGAGDTEGLDDEAWDVAPMPDGRIVVVGRGGVARFTPDGSPDTSLDPSIEPADAPPGFARPEVHLDERGIGINLNHLRAVTPGPGDSVYLAGDLGGFYGALARMLPDGSLDPNFGDPARFPTAPPLFARVGVGGYYSTNVGALAALPGGGLLVATRRSWFDRESANIRVGIGLHAFNDAGREIPGFGNGPSVSPELHSGSWLGSNARDGSPADVDLAADGRIVAAGWAGNRGHAGAWVARFDANGMPDPTFGRKASVYARPMPVSAATDVEVGPDGKMTVALLTARNKRAANDHRSGYAVLRLNPDGSRDRTFGGRGKSRGVLHLPFPPAADAWPDPPARMSESPERTLLAHDPQGRLLVLAASNSTLHVARLADAPAATPPLLRPSPQSNFATESRRHGGVSVLPHHSRETQDKVDSLGAEVLRENGIASTRETPGSRTSQP